jgi:Ser/Thr protein kinase RdoA (MazF antagonist)
MNLSGEQRELKDWLKDTYTFDNELVCEHLRSHTNDVYLVRASSRQYIFKLYHDAWHTEGEIGWEVQLLDHLANKEAAVAKAIKARNGTALSRYGPRLAVLFEYTPGAKPKEPFAASLYYEEGKSLATIHTAADDFTSDYDRKPLDVAYLITDPVKHILHKLAADADKRFLQTLAQELTDKIAFYADKGLDFGPIHGDVTLDNFHVTANGEITWYDFDSGGPGWRAYDLQGWALLEGTPDYLEKRQAFLEGYQEIRELSEDDFAVSPYLHVASEIWGLAHDLTRLKRKTDETEEGLLSMRLESLRMRARQLEALIQVARGFPGYQPSQGLCQKFDSTCHSCQFE